MLENKFGLPYEQHEKILNTIQRYAHDHFFHYLPMHNEDVRLWLCQLTTSRNIISTYVIPEAMYGDDYLKKKLITDIMAEDEEVHHYILEMQSSSITNNDLIRFQCYLGKRLAENTKISQKYQDIKSVYKLIIDAGSARKDLPHHFQENYTMRGEHDQSELPFNKMHLSIIQTKYIEEFIEDERNKDIKNSIGQLMYLFKNDTICGTIGIDERIQGVMKMHNEYMDSLEAERAYNKEREQMMIASEMSDAYDEGIGKGINALTKSFSLYVQSRFEVDIKEDLQSLSLKQLDYLSHEIYTLKTIEEIKELIKTVTKMTF